MVENIKEVKVGKNKKILEIVGLFVICLPYFVRQEKEYLNLLNKGFSIYMDFFDAFINTKASTCIKITWYIFKNFRQAT